jgi:hypothetical protein
MTSRLPNLIGGAALLAAFAFGFANVATAQTITVSGCTSFSTNGAVNAATINITCNTGGGGGATAPSCVGANIALVGSALTFTAQCAQGTNPITSVKLNGASLCSGAACTNPYPVSVPGIAVPVSTTQYTVTASDGTLSGSSTATYVVAGGGGGSVDLSGCSALGYSDARWVDVDYPSGANININYIFSTAQNAAGAKNGIFTNQSALVVRFTTPALGANDVTMPNFQAEVGSNGARQATLGTAPCLVPTTNLYPLPVVKTMISQTPTFSVKVVPNGVCNVVSYMCLGTTWLAPSTTYYITLVNKGTFTGPANTCSSSNCDMRWNFNN